MFNSIPRNQATTNFTNSVATNLLPISDIHHSSFLELRGDKGKDCFKLMLNVDELVNQKKTNKKLIYLHHFWVW